MPDDIVPTAGEFPFSLPKDGRESAYLQWIRSHSSYLTLGGIAGYLGSIFKYAVGVLNISLILLPILLMLALILGKLHFTVLRNPIITSVSIAIAIGAFASLLPVVLGDVHNRVDLFRSEVEDRKQWNRITGWFVLGLLCGLAVVGFSWLLEAWRSVLQDVTFTWLGILSSVVAGAGTIATLQKILPTQPRRLPFSFPWRSIVFGATGLGLIVLSLLILVDFVVYGNPFYLLQFVPSTGTPEIYLVFAALMLSLAAITWRARKSGQRAYRRDTILSVLLCLSPLLCLMVIVDRTNGISSLVSKTKMAIGELTRPLKTLVTKDFSGEKLPIGYKEKLDRIMTRGNQLDDLYESVPAGNDSNKSMLISPWNLEYYRAAQMFVNDAQGLIEADDLDVFRMKQLIARIDRRGIVKLADAKLKSFPAVTPHTDVVAKDAPSIQDVCWRATISQVVRRIVSAEYRSQNIRTSEQFREEITTLLSEAKVKELLSELARNFPSARYQDEFASFTGRGSELKAADLGIGTRTTSSALGTIPYVAEPTLEFAKVVRVAALEGFTLSVDETVLESALADQSVVEPEHIDTLKQTLKRELLRRKMRGKSIADLVDDSRLAEVSTENVETARIARAVILERALVPEQNRDALKALAELAHPPVRSVGSLDTRMATYKSRPASVFQWDELIDIAMTKFTVQPGETDRFLPADQVVVMVGTGEFGDLELWSVRNQLSAQAYPIKHRLLLTVASLLLVVAFCFFDFNASSIHGFYRDSLSETFLLRSKDGHVEPEADVRLSELCQPGSISPYPLINAVINLQGSRDLGLRDTRCDSFLFSKLFCGGFRTGYVNTSVLERAYPHIKLNTAMAISAAAASPNMGRYTNGFAVMLMTILNVRLGYWIPNPMMLEVNALGEKGDVDNRFLEVFEKEFNQQIVTRWDAIYGSEKPSCDIASRPSAGLELVGYASSGGGIRSAALNLGIIQGLDEAGVFSHIDYISTVSGGGYIGCALVTSMRLRESASNKGSPAGDSIADCECVEESWRLPFFYLIREMVSQLNETSPWVNLSDGGHLENLGVIELLRRRCKYIIVGDGEAEPRSSEFVFNGLGTLQRIARVELGVEIYVDTNPLLPNKETGLSQQQWVVGRIIYPREGESSEEGYLLYLKSSLTGKEETAIQEYKKRNDQFPHESTIDQFFDMDQFESYRNLGVQIFRAAFGVMQVPAAENSSAKPSRKEFLSALEQLARSGEDKEIKSQ